MKYEDMDKCIGIVLKKYRTDKKLTVRTVGEMLSLNNSTIIRWETGENSIREKDLLHYLDLLDRSYDEFLKDLNSSNTIRPMRTRKTKAKAKTPISKELRTEAV